LLIRVEATEATTDEELEVEDVEEEEEGASGSTSGFGSVFVFGTRAFLALDLRFGGIAGAAKAEILKGKGARDKETRVSGKGC
jgi:hypothetical protein